MKKSILSLTMIAAVALSGSVMTSCKKGEGDPAMPFKSRKARLTGEWKLTEGNEQETQTYSGNTDTYSYNYSETNVTYSSGGSTTTIPYTREMTFEKDRSFEMVEVSDGETYTQKGHWYWIGKNKGLDLKNKEAVGITIENYTDPSGTTNYTGVGGAIYVIQQLKNKEMIIAIDNSSSSAGNSDATTGELTFEKQ